MTDLFHKKRIRNLALSLPSTSFRASARFFVSTVDSSSFLLYNFPVLCCHWLGQSSYYRALDYTCHSTVAMTVLYTTVTKSWYMDRFLLLLVGVTSIFFSDLIAWKDLFAASLWTFQTYNESVCSSALKTVKGNAPLCVGHFLLYIIVSDLRPDTCNK